MIQFLIARKADGFIYGTQLQDDPDDGPIIPQSESPIEGAILIRYDGAFSRTGRRDSEAAYWRGDDDGVEWVETSTLEQAQAIAWTAAKNARDAAEAAPFEFEGMRFDPNKINLAGGALRALMAQLAGQSITRTWTLADNTEAVLTGEQIIGAGSMLADRVDAIHAHGRELRALIENATTPAEAYGYTWNSLDA